MSSRPHRRPPPSATVAAMLLIRLLVSLMATYALGLATGMILSRYGEPPGQLARRFQYETLTVS